MENQSVGLLGCSEEEAGKAAPLDEGAVKAPGDGTDGCTDEPDPVITLKEPVTPCGKNVRATRLGEGGKEAEWRGQEGGVGAIPVRGVKACF